MITSSHLRSLLAAGASLAALTVAAPAFAQSESGAQGATGGVGVAPSSGPTAPTGEGPQAPVTSGRVTPPASAEARRVPAGGARVEEIIVTAQRREEGLQSVPIAVSAFSAGALKATRIEGGQDLKISVPNVNFSRGNFGGFNFSVRGIGSKLVAAGADAAIGIHQNSIPLTANTLADTDFYDVERVEVLRGPQGTQFGRNSTGGLVNIITAKPTDKFSAAVTGEFGNFDTKRVKAYINVPLGDMLSVRDAVFYLNRGGFGKNLVTGNDIDGRDLYSNRLTIGFKDNNRLRGWFMWEHFDEDDNRARIGKQLCIKDPGPTSVGGVPVPVGARGFLSQGCLGGDYYSDAAFGTVNSGATLGGLLGNLTGLITGDAYAGKVQNKNLYNIEAAFDPQYRTKQDTYELNVEFDLTPSLRLISLSSYNEYDQTTFNDYNRVVPTTPFNSNVALGPIPLTDATGVFNDPQVGSSRFFRTFDYTPSRSHQSTTELRLASSFKGPINFSVGGSLLNFDTNTNYYVLSNTLTAYSRILNFLTGNGLPGGYSATPVPSCLGPVVGGVPTLNGGTGASPCVFVDPNSPPNATGHNYYDNQSFFRLRSKAVFGELYWQVLDDVKVTAGYRYTEDHKVNAYIPEPLLAPGIGRVAVANQYADFGESTGRFNIDWTPHLSFTDKTLVYASFSRGYKAGGFNPPGSIQSGAAPPTYEPEFINAFEVGTKNTLFGGQLILNATGFYYDYSGYQVSAIVNRTSVNTNIDATIKGLEIESVWEPIRNLRFNANLGLLDTEITGGAQVDVLNRTQGNPALFVVKNLSSTANCVVPTAAVAGAVALANSGAVPATTAIGGLCAGAYAPGGPLNLATGITATPTEGVPVNLKGKELPNAPSLTFSLGAQYRAELGGGWRATPRVDFYYQDSSYSRIFNSQHDILQSYINLNATLALTKPEWGVDVQFFIRNLTDERVVTDVYLTDDSSGLFSNLLLNEPREYGISLTKSF